MRKLLKLLGIAAATVVILIAALATIGFLKGGKRARESGLPRAGASVPPAPQGAAAASKSDGAKVPAVERPGAPAATERTVAAGSGSFIAGLNQLEAQGKHADAAVAAFKEIPSLSWSGRAELIAWMKDRVKDGRMPAMFWIARAYSYNSDTAEAARWYAAAGLAGRIDAARLADVSAASAVPAVETHFGEVKKALKDDAALRRSALAWALEHEEATKDRGVAAWIAAHGMDSFKGGPPKVVADEAWLAKRESIRESWRKMSSAE